MDPNSPNPDSNPHSNPSPDPAPGLSRRPADSRAQPAQVVYLQSAPGPMRRWFSWLGWVAFFFALSAIAGLSARQQQYFDTSGGIQEKHFMGPKKASDKIAVLDVSGVIGTRTTYIKKQIDRVREDKTVKAMVLRVDSPGGTITGSDYILHHLTELREERDIPLVISMGSIAASGGYYVAMAVGDDPNTIYAEPTTTTGSIGVIIPHYDISGFLQRHDIKDDSIVSHPRKQMLSMTRPISPDDRGVLEIYLKDAFERFKDVVKSGRPDFRADPSRLDELATGEIFTATRAKNKGLVDELGFVEDAIERAAELAGLVEGSYRTVRYKQPLTLMDALIATKSRSHAMALDGILDLGVPKAYYLATSFPSLVASWHFARGADD